MNEAYKRFLYKNNLSLKKVVEHTRDDSLEFIFESPKFTDPELLNIELKEFINFKDNVYITLHEVRSNDNDPFLLENEEENTKIEEPKDEDSKDNTLEESSFSLEEWQKQQLEQLEEEVLQEESELNSKAVNSKNEISVNLNPGDVIIGKEIKNEPVPIGDIDFANTIHEKNICLEGKVFSIEKENINEKSCLYTIGITDYTGSIYIKRFVPVKQEKQLAAFDKYITPGQQIKVFGNVEYDDFSKDKVMKPYSITLLEKKVRTDNYPEKRIELHLHTQYSALDSVAKAKEVIQRIKDFGHSAVGITDHGVLQAYPEIQNLTRGTDIKPLYGVEGYLVDTGAKIVTGEQDQSLDDEIIFFDLETTGTSVYTDKVIEIAAVKCKNGKILESFQTFVNPHEKLKPKIIELTGITDKEVAGGKEEDEAFNQFLDFVGNRIIAAHNATFDTTFLKRWLDKNNIHKEFTVIDSLPLARSLVPEIARYNMGRLCSFFKIKNEHAHRAIDDSIASAKVLDKLFERAKEKGVSKISELNSLITIQNMALKNAHTNHIIIYAKNQDGLHDLYELVSESHLKYFNKRPRIPKILLTEKRENLIIGSACASGELFEAVVDNAPDHVLMDIASFYDFLEVQPIDNNRFLMRNNPKITEETLRNFNRKIINLGEKLNKPVVATGDVHFVDPEDAIFRDIITSSKNKSKISFPIPLYLRSTEEMLEEFKYLDPQKAKEIVITNTHVIADQIENILPIPNGTFPPVIEGAEEEIRQMCEDEAHRLYGPNLPEEVEKRMNRELNSIISNGYAVLYLIAQKLVKHSEDDGFLVGSRGSVGSSFVARLSGITEVNSLPAHYVCPKCHYTEFPGTPGIVGPDLEDKECPECGHLLNKDGFDIPFEVFLGFEGDKEPDIDLNFSGDNQAEAHRFTEVLFGKGKTFRAGTISTIKDATAFGYVKNYFDERGKTVSKAEIERLKIGCTGIKRTTGQHPGGIMVVPKDNDIYQFTPVQHPADDTTSDIITTHFDYHSISGRLLKLDILGHDDPTMLRRLENITNKNPREIPLDDEGVLKLFTGTESLNFKYDCPLTLGTSGVPEFGTSFVKGLVEEAKPKTFADLLRISGLSHGTDVWTNNAQSLIKSGTTDIQHVISTRDDIMLNLIHFGLEPKLSFTIMEKVRKGKGLSEDDIKAMKEKKVPNWFIESCKKIKYLFPKAHAAAYVIMALRIAWYKINYPLAYYACYFGIRAKEFDLKTISSGLDAVRNEIARLEDLGRQGDLSNKEALSLVSLELALEMYCRGFSVQNVNLQKSHYSDFVIENDSLIPPFSTISGMGDQAAKSLYDTIHSGPIISQDEILEKSKITKSNLQALEEMGCLENIPKSNQVSFF